MESFDVFVTVVKSGSFSNAAKLLHRSPSAISKQIGQLETRLNVQLFERTTRKIKLTDAGELYYERAIDITNRIQDAETELKELSGEAVGQLRITFPNSLSSSPIIPVLSRFASTHPKVSLDINVSIEKKNLLEDGFDFAFRLGPLSDSGMIGLPLFSIEPAFCASPELVERYGQPSTLYDLMKYPLLIPHNVSAASMFKDPDTGASIKPQNQVHSGVDIATFINLAAQGFSAAFCFRHMLAEHQATEQLIDITPPGINVKVPVHLVYQHYQFMPVKKRAFIDEFKHAFRS